MIVAMFYVGVCVVPGTHWMFMSANSICKLMIASVVQFAAVEELRKEHSDFQKATNLIPVCRNHMRWLSS